MEFAQFVRKPFTIDAVQITADNFDAVAELIGKEVKETRKGDKFILVDRRIIPNGFKAYIGWWVTKLDDQLRCYPQRPFNDQFEPMNDSWRTLLNLQAVEAEVREESGIEESLERVEAHGTPVK